MSTLWTEGEARAFLGKKIKDIGGRSAACGSDGVPYLLPDQVRTMRLDSPRVREALQACAAAEAGDIVLIIGPGGSGKSVLFRAVAHSVPNALSLAPTGVAALNLQEGGWLDRRSYKEYGTAVPRTINSGLHLPPSDYYRSKDIDEVYIDPDVTHIMVDEVSMVNPNMMDVLVYLSKAFRVPLLLFGDPLQLPPVEKDRDEDSPAAMYPQWRFFGSYGWMLQNEDRLKCIMLDSVYRQDDPGFKSLLNRAREGMLTDADARVLKGRVVDEIPKDSLVLCFKNETATAINNGRKGKNKPTVYCSSLYKYIFDEDDPFKGAIDLVWVDEAGRKEPEATSHEALLIMPREDAGPDEYEWVDMKTNGRPATELASSATVMKRLELYPGDRVMITRNMKVPYATSAFGDNLYGFLHGRNDMAFPYDGKGTEYRSVVNGTMGTYLGMCNALACRADFYDELEGSLRSLGYDESYGREASTHLRLRAPVPDEDIYVRGTSPLTENEVVEIPLLVRLDDGTVVLVPQVMFTATRTDKRGNVYETENVVQYPLRPAFAITYHKSQGLTLDKVHMILSPDDPMPPGLGYLGLSRCRSLEGLTLSEYVPEAFVCDIPSRNFLRRIQLMTETPSAEECRRLLVLSDERTNEAEAVYSVSGCRARFRNIRRALAFANIPDADCWTYDQQVTFSCLSEKELSRLASPDAETARQAREEYGLPEFRLPAREEMRGKDLLWDMNRTKLHLHPELVKLLHMSGETKRQTGAAVDRLEREARLDQDPSVSFSYPSTAAFMELRKPRPGGRDHLDPGEFSRMYLERLKAKKNC